MTHTITHAHTHAHTHACDRLLYMYRVLDGEVNERAKVSWAVG